MQSQFSRTELLMGSEAMEKLFSARVAVFGVGGVGGCRGARLLCRLWPGLFSRVK